MQNAKDKAEAFVRSKIPELMELSEGCEVTVTENFEYKPNFGKATKLAPFNAICTGTYYSGCSDPECCGDMGTKQAIVLNSDIPLISLEHHDHEIIGHPIQLHHWLSVLGDKVIKTIYQSHNERFACYINDNVAFYFNKDGQPLYEADYKAIHNLLGLE